MEFRFVLQTLIATSLTVNLTLLSCSLCIFFASLGGLYYFDNRFTYFLKRQIYIQLAFSTVLFLIMIWISSLQLFDPSFKKASAATFTYIIYALETLIGIAVIIYLLHEGKLHNKIVRK